MRLQTIRQLPWPAGVALSALLAACAPSQLVKETVRTLDTLGRQQNERRSFLGVTTAIFYPQGVPVRMSELPLLDSSQVALIQKDLERQTKRLMGSLNSNLETMASALGQPVKRVDIQKIAVDQNYAATVALQDDGSVLVDVKVIQGIFRGVLLSAIEAPGEGEPGLPGTPTEKSQKDALELVIQSREMYLSASAIPTVQTLKEIQKARRSGARSMEEIGSSVIDSSLVTAGAMFTSTRASTLYDDALSFVIAHELGHRALGHFDRLSMGETRAKLELEADRFGALLVTLSRNEGVTPNWGYDSPPPGRGYYQVLGSKICLDDHNFKPDGYSSFFKYGYVLSGFDSLGGQATEYPPTSQRLELSRHTTATAHQYIDLAQDDLGTCYPDRERQKQARTHPEVLFENHFAFFKKELGEMNKLKGYGWSEDDLRKRQVWLEDNSSDRDLSKSVYMAFVSVMSKQR